MNKRKKVIWQIFPSFLIITLLSLFAVSWYSSKSLYEFYKEHTALDLYARARLLEKLVIEHLSPPDSASVDAMCKEMGKRTETRFTIVLPTGLVVGDSIETPAQMENHSNRPEILQALAGENGQSVRFSKTLQQEMMYVASPITERQKPIAVVRASLPITFIENELNLIQIKIIIGGIIIALIAAGISLAISSRISRPLERMKKEADLFAEGDFSHRLKIPETTEMAGLAEAINQMVAQLQDRIKTVSEQRNELEAVLSSMLEGVIAVDGEEQIVSMNQAAAELFETDLEAYQGRSIQEIVRNNALQQFIGKAITSSKPLQEDITLSHNQQRVLDAKSSPLLDADHFQIGTLVVLNDVTHLRRLENMRRDFVANVSHEIKTPLTAIKGFVETLQHGKVEKPEETGRFLGIIQKHVDRLNSIIEDLLTLSKIEQEDETGTLNCQNCRIADVFPAAIQIIRSKAEEKKLSIEISGNENVRADFDPTLIEQAVVNLLDNAIKYSDPGNTITVTSDSRDSEILISVRDQGIGIAQKHLPRLFERFYRIDRSRSRQLGGTGLGLAIVKHIAKAHGGYVTVISSLGEGSTFTIHLPAND
jgi:two-component system phosphate regulon sensor histidine kinase PhoR